MIDTRVGTETREPCVLCGGPLATCNWGLCGCCRYERQQEAKAAVKRLRRIHPDWYPQESGKGSRT